VEWLARRDQTGRAEVVQALRNAGPSAYPHLILQLQDERLAVRAAAAGVLQGLADGGPPFDPFAAADARQAQCEAWLVWVAVQPTAP
jgi:HEAT repeat protein